MSRAPARNLPTGSPRVRDADRAATAHLLEPGLTRPEPERSRHGGAQLSL